MPTAQPADPSDPSQPGERQLAYWRRALADPQPLDLPLDHPRPPVASHRGAALPFTLGGATVERMRRLCAAAGAELSIGVLAGLAATLHRLTGQRQIAIGLAASNSAGAANRLVLRAEVSGEEGFGALVGQLAAVARDAFAHRDVPFEVLAGELERPPDPSRHPLFQVGFGRLAAGETPSLELARYDLDFLFAEDEQEQKLAGWVVYAAELFTATKVERLLAALTTLLEAAAADPRMPLARLPLLPAADRLAILAGHGSTPLEFPQDRLLHETFFRQAAATPGKIALRAGPTALSYADTAALASRIARALIEEGAGPEVRVGVFLERDHRLVATLIGVLAAGAAYVPLDPEYPAERIGFTLDDAEARLIVTSAALRQRLPASSATILTIEELAASQDLPATPPPRRAEPRNLAYLIYTSGSTGRPKGVAITHRSASAFLEWTRQVFSEREMACVLFSTSICFDISIFEMFATLQRGGTVVVAQNAFDLPQLECRDQITLIDTVPSVARELLRGGPLPPGVETVNLAGEALPQDLVDRCWQEPGVSRVYNFYGPSEDTTFSTYEMCRPGLPPTIGHLIAGSRGFVVDRGLELLPLGFPGELYLAGEGLSRGYLGRPRLTAERYLPDPFSGQPGARMYRSGDLIRHREDGGFDFCGRLDHQVKVRGYRVELGEIENLLRQHESVGQAVVVAREDGPAGLRLVSYVVPKEGATADGEALHAFLARRLPPFMVPAATVFLGAFPLTPNGKVDRKTLPAPETLGADRRDYRPPETAAELALAAIWSELLQRPEIGKDDDFFALGGDSILVIQAVSRAAAAGWDIDARELFAHTTLEAAAGIARKVSPAEQAPEESHLEADELAGVLADLEGIF